MFHVTSTPPTSATQMATFRLDASEGAYIAQVSRTSEVDDAGRTGWALYFQYTPLPTGQGFGLTLAHPHELIFSHDTDPLDVLATLAVFVAAWDEAQRYDGSENADIFPATCLPWLAAAEEFGTWAVEHEYSLEY